MTTSLKCLQRLSLVFLLPALFVSCNMRQGDTDPTGYSGDLGELGMTFSLAEGWVSGELSRNTEGSIYQGWLDSTPQEVHHIYEDKKPDNPDRLVHGRNFYIHTDVQDDNWGEVMNGQKEQFFRYALTIDYYANKKPGSLLLWREGKCHSSQHPDTPQLCQKSTPSHRLVRRLDPTEIPFNADAGFLYESDFQYGNQEGMVAKELIYYFYVVIDNKSYGIRFRGVGTDPAMIGPIEEKTLIREASIDNMLSSIQFI